MMGFSEARPFSGRGVMKGTWDLQLALSSEDPFLDIHKGAY